MCRSGCPTPGAHSSYGECCRAATVRVAYCASANGFDASKQKRWDNELARYRDLKSQGIQPNGTSHVAMDIAERVSDATGTAYTA